MQNISRGSTFRTQLLPRVGAGEGQKEEVGIITTWMRVPAELNLGPLRWGTTQLLLEAEFRGRPVGLAPNFSSEVTVACWRF